MLDDNNLRRSLQIPMHHESTVDNRYGVRFEFKELYNRLLEVQANQLSQDTHQNIRRKLIRFPSLSQLSKSSSFHLKTLQNNSKQLHPLPKNILFSTFDSTTSQHTTNHIKKSSSITPGKQRLSLENSKSQIKLQPKLEKYFKKKRVNSRINLKFKIP
ncbi:unnamed protein product [Blepharisma stoltei]|uniref:Uncharacterized protein n=1 Tax=Blepharisma stoltei TaxID=1481888 RepID=A0AAU9K8Y7_9CILI|nr:unnamed protein product [Blepharisma stoltei]